MNLELWSNRGNILFIQIDIAKGLSGLPPDLFRLLQCKDNRLIGSSLQTFVDSAKEGLLDQLIRLEGGSKEDVRSVKLYSFSPETKINTEPYSRFCRDGDFGLILSSTSHRNHLGCVSFDIIDETARKRLYCIPSQCLPLNIPIITQIQGTTYGERPKEKIFPGFIWTNVLVQLISAWALNQGFPSILSVPAELHKDYPLFDEEEKERFVMHYDVTVRRCGFRRNAGTENSPWFKPLIYPGFLPDANPF